MTAPTETFDPILTSECQPNQPMTSELALRWRANHLASMQGAAGAQRLYVQALERLVAGTTQAALNATVQTGAENSDAWATIWSLGFVQGGSIRFSGEFRETTANAGQTEVRLVRTRGDVVTNITVGSVDSTTFTALTLDFTIQCGDVFLVQHRHSVANNAAAETRNMRLSTGGQDIFPVGGLAGFTTLITALTP